MNYLQLVQTALKRAGIRNKEPSTLTGALDIVADMADWVQDAWRELQEESLNWWFRAKLDQKLPLHEDFASTVTPPSDDQFTLFNEFEDPDLDGRVATWTFADLSDWRLTGNSLYILFPASYEDTVNISFRMEPNTTYHMHVEFAEPPGGPASTQCKVYMNGTSLGTSTSETDAYFLHTTGDTINEHTIGFQGVSGYWARINGIRIMRTTNTGKLADDAYELPANLETLNWRTLTVYTEAKTDETPVQFIPYEDWRNLKDTMTTTEGRPKYITERPDGVLQVWPVPDQDYVLRYDGVWDVDEMTLDTDTPGYNTTGEQTLQDRHHHTLVWSAVARYCEHYEDPEGLERAQRRYRAAHSRLQERRIPDVWVPMGTLTGYNPGDRVGPRRIF